MKTPYGFECQYYYTDYYRGKSVEECRLLANASFPGQWDVRLCKHCPVPSILRANSCTHMTLKGAIKKQFFGLSRIVQVTAFCSKINREVEEPHIGCGECHPINEIFFQAK